MASLFICGIYLKISHYFFLSESLSLISILLPPFHFNLHTFLFSPFLFNLHTVAFSIFGNISHLLSPLFPPMSFTF